MRVRQHVSWILGIGLAAAFGPTLNAPAITPAAASVGQPALAQGESQVRSPDVPAAASSQQTPSVTYHDGHLSVHAERIPLGRLLQEVARQTGLEVRQLSSLQQDVSVEFTGLPLFEGLHRVLARVNHLLLIERSAQGNMPRIQALVFARASAPSLERLPGDRPPPVRESRPAGALRQAMGDADPGVRRGAVQRLGEQGAEQALPHLLAALDDIDPGVRQAALASLSQYGERALEPLQARLQREEDPTVRLVALQVVAQVGRGNEATVTLLREMLADHEPHIRAAVVEALGSVGGPGAADVLHTAALDGDPEVRLAALRVLALHVRDSSARAAIAQHLDDADQAVRDSAVSLLETFNE